MTVSNLVPASKRLACLAAVLSLSLSPATAHADLVQWFVNDLTFADGATGSGSFFFDADLPFGTHNAITNVNVTVSGGTTFPDLTFNSVNPTSAGNAAFLYFVADPSIEMGDTALAASLVGQMTSAGGSVSFLTTGNAAFRSQYSCGTAGSCGLGGTPQNPITGGTVTAVPEPSAFLLLSLVGVAGGCTRWWQKRRCQDTSTHS